jgi:hypothetical protein
LVSELLAINKKNEAAFTEFSANRTFRKGALPRSKKTGLTSLLFMLHVSWRHAALLYCGLAKSGEIIIRSMPFGDSERPKVPELLINKMSLRELCHQNLRDNFLVFHLIFYGSKPQEALLRAQSCQSLKSKPDRKKFLHIFCAVFRDTL